MGGSDQMLIFAEKKSGWGWPNADVSKKKKKTPKDKNCWKISPISLVQATDF